MNLINSMSDRKFQRITQSRKIEQEILKYTFLKEEGTFFLFSFQFSPRHVISFDETSLFILFENCTKIQLDYSGCLFPPLLSICLESRDFLFYNIYLFHVCDITLTCTNFVKRARTPERIISQRGKRLAGILISRDRRSSSFLSPEL